MEGEGRDENPYPRIRWYPTRFYFIAIFRSFVWTKSGANLSPQGPSRTQIWITVDKDWINLLFTIVESGITDTIIISPLPLPPDRYLLPFFSSLFFWRESSLPLQFLTCMIYNQGVMIILFIWRIKMNKWNLDNDMNINE